jgi:hypothetical protein
MARRSHLSSPFVESRFRFSTVKGFIRDEMSMNHMRFATHEVLAVDTGIQKPPLVLLADGCNPSRLCCGLQHRI